MYTKHWKLNRKPFTTAFDPDLVHYHDSFAALLHALTMIARVAPETVWIVGPDGAGKTTLLRALQQSIEQEVRFKLIFASLLRGQSRFAERIGQPRDEPWSETVRNSLPMLDEYFQSDSAADRPVVLAIEDADKVVDEPIIWECQSLFGLPRERGWPLTVIFTAAEIPEVLKPSPKRPAQAFELPAPGKLELKAIIEHRLSVSGADKEIFSPGAMQTLIALSQSNLTKLILLCDLSMQIAYVSGRRWIGDAMVREKVYAHARGLLALGELPTAEQEEILQKEETEKTAATPASPVAAVVSATGVEEGGPEAGERGEKQDSAATGKKVTPAPASLSERTTSKTPTVESQESKTGESSTQSGVQVKPQEGQEVSESKSAAQAETQSAAEGPSPLLYRAELQRYRLGRPATPTPPSPAAEQLSKGEGKTDATASEKNPKVLYNVAVDIIRTTLNRLRDKEFVELAPVRELSKAIVNAKKSEMELVRLTSRDDDKSELDIHLVNVAILATACGRKMGMSQEDLEILCEISLVHDVGHLQCREELIHSEDRFDREDYKTIKQHPIVGSEIIKKQTDGSELMAQVILQEHERDNGLGYPNYLEGDKIHRYAKIIGVCDVYEALTHSRAHRKALSPAAALGEIASSWRRLSTARIVNALQWVVQSAFNL